MIFEKVEVYAAGSAASLIGFIEAVGTDAHPLWKLILAALFVINVVALINKMTK